MSVVVRKYVSGILTKFAPITIFESLVESKSLARIMRGKHWNKIRSRVKCRKGDILKERVEMGHFLRLKGRNDNRLLVLYRKFFILSTYRPGSILISDGYIIALHCFCTT